MHEGTGKELTKCRVYKAENISTDKMLDALNHMREVAHQNHNAKVAEWKKDANTSKTAQSMWKWCGVRIA